MKKFRHSLPDPHKIARYYSKIAVRALYDELSLYPKPGLVSFVDSGAHQDMNGSLFFRSLFGLRHYFFKVALHSAQGKSLHQLVHYGLEAELIMNTITRGVNTHRGAIFAMGILCASIAKLSAREAEFSTHDLQQAIINDWADYLKYIHRNENTHGAVVKKKYNIEDAKHIAINGYAPVFNVFHDLSRINREDKTFFGLLAYKNLLINIDDINILYRTGPDGLKFARHHIQKAVVHDRQEELISNFIKVHHIFSQKEISPGGVADMLGLIYFLHRVFTE